MAMWPPLATVAQAMYLRQEQAAVAWAALRPVAREYLRPEAKHCLGLARHSSAQDFRRQAILAPVALLLQATVVRRALRPVAREYLRPEAKHCLGLARHSSAQDFHQAILAPVASLLQAT